MLMKRILLLFICLALTLSVSACSTKESSATSVTASTSAIVTSTTESTSSTAATSVPATTSTSAPTSTTSLTSVKPSLPPTTATTSKDPVQQLVDSMSLDEKIGQMIICGFDNINDILPIISKYKLCGVILYKENIISVAQTIRDIGSIKSNNALNKIQLFFSVDQEGGRISRFPAEMGAFESALSIGNRNDLTYAYNSGVKIAQAMKKLGFNLDFAPVMDVFSNPQSTVIGDRAYGTTADRVSRIGVEVLKGLRSQNIIPTAKHFPGHGDTDVDSHFGLPIVNKTLSQLNNLEFKPFKAAISNNVGMIMIAHILLAQVDSMPSSLSREVITDILRKQLGYKGVIITDDITMSAIVQNYSIPAASVMAVNAGCDIILVAHGPQNAVQVIEALKSAVQQGNLTEQRVNESVYRILQLKRTYQIK